jgi:hypothetical protein
MNATTTTQDIRADVTRIGTTMTMGKGPGNKKTWIRSVLRKIIDYKARHQRFVDEAATTLQLALPQDHDIVMRNVLPFLELELPHLFTTS